MAPPKEKNSKLQNESIEVYLKETDPRNPYGPNFEELPESTKVYYKFNRVKKYVHLEKEDEDILLSQNMKFLYGILGTLALGIAASFTTKQLILKPFIPKMHEFVNDYKGIYYGVVCSGCMTYSYYTQYEVFINDICYPMMLKYTQEAIKNGFEDYEISKFKKFDMEEELNLKRENQSKLSQN